MKFRPRGFRMKKPTELDLFYLLKRTAKNLKRKQNKFNLIPTNQFKNDFYPWFEPSTAPQNAEQLPKFFKREIIKLIDSKQQHYLIMLF